MLLHTKSPNNAFLDNLGEKYSSTLCFCVTSSNFIPVILSEAVTRVEEISIIGQGFCSLNH